MTLMMHTDGAFEATREQVLTVPTPDPTPTYSPVSYQRIIRLIERRLEQHGVTVVSEKWGLKAEGNELFGVLTLNIKGSMGELGSGFMIGVRASHNKRMSVSLCAGETVFVCDNMMFAGAINFSRKHVGEINEELPVRIAALVDEALASRGTQAKTWDQLRNINLNPSVTVGVIIPRLDGEDFIWPAQCVEMPGKTAARQLLLTAKAKGILTGKQELQVAEEFHKPRFPEFRGLNGFNLIQAVTTCARHEKGWNADQIFSAPVKMTELILATIVPA